MKNSISNLLKLNRKALATAMICAAGLTLSACSTTASDSNPNGYAQGAAPAKSGASSTYNETELMTAISDHLGVTAESAASSLEKLFQKQGRPVGYITGEEGGGAIIFGAKYGEGTLWMKNGKTQKVYWKGPTVGFDAGAEVSRVFTLVYDLDNMNDIYRRFPGVDGSAFLVAGMAVHYERANGITLAPVRAGAGVRLGANVGYTSYVKKKPKGFGLIPI